MAIASRGSRSANAIASSWVSGLRFQLLWQIEASPGGRSPDAPSTSSTNTPYRMNSEMCSRALNASIQFIPVTSVIRCCIARTIAGSQKLSGVT